MARIQTPQHVQELQAEFKVREQFGLELLETVQPTYQLGRQKIASTGYPRKAMAVIAGGAGGVGENTECSLTCPADIGILILLEEIWIRDIGGSVGMRIWNGAALADVATIETSKNFRDGRITAASPDGIIRTSDPLTAAPNGDEVASISVLADDTIIFKPEIILGGGAFFLVRQSTANVGLTVTMLWTEFLLEDR